MWDETKCPLCKSATDVHVKWPVRGHQNPVALPANASAATFFDCRKCGQFVMSYYDMKLLLDDVPANQDLQAVRDKVLTKGFRIRALLWENEVRDRPTPWLLLRDEAYPPVESDRSIVQINLDELLRHWPDSLTERVERIMLNLERQSKRLGDLVGFERRASSFLTDLYAEDATESKFTLNALIGRGLVRMEDDRYEVSITDKGWDYLDRLRHRRPSPLNPAFVAMWYGDRKKPETIAAMSELFATIIRPSAEAVGYNADRADVEIGWPHDAPLAVSTKPSDFIMDKVLGMIRIAPFVIADYTENRNGVYFEAGYARGLGLTVIHTCREDSFEKAHFDVKQIDTILWAKPEELKEKLVDRIRSRCGPGPYPIVKA